MMLNESIFWQVYQTKTNKWHEYIDIITKGQGSLLQHNLSEISRGIDDYISYLHPIILRDVITLITGLVNHC